MNRRSFLGTLAVSALAEPAAPRVNGARLREHLEALSVFGRPAGGSVCRRRQPRGLQRCRCRGAALCHGPDGSAGLQPRIDAAGNFSARRAGTDSTLAPVLFGSHIDSVPGGGNFDGDLGSLAAIEVVQTLNEAGVATRRPLEVVVW